MYPLASTVGVKRCIPCSFCLGWRHALEVKCVNQFAAIRALGPQVIGHALAFVARTSEFWFVEDTHLFEILCTK